MFNFDPGVVIPMMIFAIPIIAILTGHQRKMAELMQSRHAAQNLQSPEIQILRAEILELKDLVRQQAIALDTLQNKVLESRSPESTLQNLNNNG